MTVNRLADRLRTDADVVSVARLLRGPDADLGDVLKEIIAEEHVPFLARTATSRPAWTSAASGSGPGTCSAKRTRPASSLDIDVPPKYAGADFQKQSYWRHRGKLDVPEGALHLLPRRQPRQRPELPADRLGWLGPP